MKIAHVTVLLQRRYLEKKKRCQWYPFGSAVGISINWRSRFLGKNLVISVPCGRLLRLVTRDGKLPTSRDLFNKTRVKLTWQSLVQTHLSSKLCITLIANRIHLLLFIDPQTGEVLYIVRYKSKLRFIFLYLSTNFPMLLFRWRTCQNQFWWKNIWESWTLAHTKT